VHKWSAALLLLLLLLLWLPECLATSSTTPQAGQHWYWFVASLPQKVVVHHPRE
jgi:hypothetical protein